MKADDFLADVPSADDFLGEPDPRKPRRDRIRGSTRWSGGQRSGSGPPNVLRVRRRSGADGLLPPHRAMLVALLGCPLDARLVLLVVHGLAQLQVLLFELEEAVVPVHVVGGAGGCAACHGMVAFLVGGEM